MTTTQSNDIRKMFDRISANYDRTNRLLSFGLDQKWRRALAQHLPASNHLTLLDLATGTGDQILSLINKKASIDSAIGIDISEEMLKIARKKLLMPTRGNSFFLRSDKQLCTSDTSEPIQNLLQITNSKESTHPVFHVSFECCDAEQLPFDDNTFDVCTFSFGIRNVQNPLKALSEIYRVTKNNGRCLILEFSLPHNRLRHIYRLYLRHIMPFLGGMLTHDFAAYRYLNESIEKFPPKEQFLKYLHQTKWRDAKAIELLFGCVTIYRADKNAK